MILYDVHSSPSDGFQFEPAAEVRTIDYSWWAKPQAESAIDRFVQLKDQWLADTLFTSSLHDITSHDAYLAIIGMGATALPLILEDLSEEPKYWFSALRAIANEDPVPPEAIGNLEQMTEAWLEWGRENQYFE